MDIYVDQNLKKFGLRGGSAGKFLKYMHSLF